MNWNRKIQYCYYTAQSLYSMHIVRMVPLIALAGVVFAQVWEADKFLDACREVFRWELILIGPLMAALLLLLSYGEMIKSENIMIHMGGRTKLFINLLWGNCIITFLISAWVIFILFVIGQIMFSQEISSSLMFLLLRTGICLWLLLHTLGIFFYIIQWGISSLVGVICTLGVVGIEAAGEFYFENQIFWKYAFPMETKLYYAWGDFIMGILWLLLLGIVLYCILYFILQNKDFLPKQEGKEQ